METACGNTNMHRHVALVEKSLQAWKSEQGIEVNVGPYRAQEARGPRVSGMPPTAPSVRNLTSKDQSLVLRTHHTFLLSLAPGYSRGHLLSYKISVRVSGAGQWGEATVPPGEDGPRGQ